MKKLASFLLSGIMIFSFASCNKTDEVKETSQTTVETIDESIKEGKVGFKVEGTKLLDAKGNEFVMRGVNHGHNWFKRYRDEALTAIADTGANTVRLVLSNGVQWEKDTLEEVIELIEKCKELKLIAVLEVHDATGKDTIAELEKATDYWIEIKDALIGNEDYVILNIANEWVGKWKSEVWRDGYVQEIPKLREAGIFNAILIDAAGWGQYAESIHEFGKEVFEADEHKNTFFSIHMYGYGGKDEKAVKNNIDKVTEQDLCVVIGEFGHNHSDGDVDEETIISYSNEKNVGYLGWSWKGNSADVSYLDIALTWQGTFLSEDWGERLINGEGGITQTSKIATVFE